MINQALDLWLDLYWTVRASVGDALTEIGWRFIMAGMWLSTGASIHDWLKDDHK